jgi:surfactin synthase thioesterase subunit
MLDLAPEPNRWLIRRDPRPAAAHRLHCFPYVGGSAGEFLRWADLMPDVEVSGVVPPGRGNRLFEPPFTRLPDLVAAVVAEAGIPAGAALFGHSLGALLAYETARALTAAGRPPAALVVSGHRPPHLPHGDTPVHHLPPDAFAEVVRARYPAPPPELTEDPELHALVLGTLRADLTVFETHQHVPGPPLDCPLLVLSGEDDVWAPRDLTPWQRHTTGACRIAMVPGDHFYLARHGDRAAQLVHAFLRDPNRRGPLRADRP